VLVVSAWCRCSVLITCFRVLSLAGYYYNSTGLLACEPFFCKPSYRILASCGFYFPTTMVLMYCYGSSFHANRFRLASTASSAFATPAAVTEKVKTSSSLQQSQSKVCRSTDLNLRFFCHHRDYSVDFRSNKNENCRCTFATVSMNRQKFHGD
jgi:hypothetical protein